MKTSNRRILALPVLASAVLGMGMGTAHAGPLGLSLPGPVARMFQVAAPATRRPRTVAPKPRRPARGTTLSGEASYYGPGLYGRKTANGERFDSRGLTAAHRTLPFGTRVRVQNLNTNRSVIVRINDRGPYAKGRMIDLSEAASGVLGIGPKNGVAPVRITLL